MNGSPGFSIEETIDWALITEAGMLGAPLRVAWDHEARDKLKSMSEAFDILDELGDLAWERMIVTCHVYDQELMWWKY